VCTTGFRLPTVLNGERQILKLHSNPYCALCCYDASNRLAGSTRSWRTRSLECTAAVRAHLQGIIEPALNLIVV
jgi:hypothetical protein